MMDTTMETSEILRMVENNLQELLSNPPASPLERLQASLCAAQAQRVLMEDAAERERLQRRSTLPSSAYRIGRENGEFAVRFNGKTIHLDKSRARAHDTAWDHHTDPVGWDDVHDTSSADLDQLDELVDLLMNDDELDLGEGEATRSRSTTTAARAVEWLKLASARGAFCRDAELEAASPLDINSGASWPGLAAEQLIRGARGRAENLLTEQESRVLGFASADPVLLLHGPTDTMGELLDVFRYHGSVRRTPGGPIPLQKRPEQGESDRTMT